KIYEYLGVDTQGARKVVIDSRRCIDATTIKQMRRQLEQQPQGVDEVEEELDRMEQEDQGQDQPQAPPQAGPSEPPSDQPSLRDIMQAIQNMELNMNQRMDHYQASIDQRFQNVEREQKSLMKMTTKMKTMIDHDTLQSHLYMLSIF
ncbi:hypothetical protein PIB30_114533, partial [Stylosanthes scabra]|nr:hypothetical protein [Stylosanthes scabra]